MMHEREKSDPAVVAVKPVNAAERSVIGLAGGESGGRGECEPAQHGPSTETGNRVTGVESIRQVARQRTKEKFTTLLHHISTDHLEQAFLELKEGAAPGVDG